MCHFLRALTSLVIFLVALGAEADLKVLNLNVWHGLDAVGTLKFGDLETNSSRKNRRERFLKLAKAGDYDVILLQEVNPVDSLSKKWANELGMDEIHQSDNCGIKVFGWGPPVNFHNGIAIFAKKELNLKKLGSKKLSGDSGFCGDLFSFQLGEFRYALAGEITTKDKTVLLATTHLHHEIGDDKYIKTVNGFSMVSDKRKNDVLKGLAGAQKRRKDEISNLINFLTELRRKKPYDEVILGGDFNSEPGGSEFQLLNSKLFYASHGFQTWRPDINPNAKTDSELKMPFGIKDSETELVEMVRGHRGSNRNLDHIFLSKPQIIELSPFPSTGPQVSDHIGISTKVSL